MNVVAVRPAMLARRQGTPDMWLLLITLFLVGLGVLMVFSASYFETLPTDPYSYLKRQGLFASLGLVVMIVAMNVDYHDLADPKTQAVLLLGTFALLGAVFFFEDTKGSYRWIRLGPVNIQPSEVAKFTLSLWLANYFGRRDRDPNDLKGDLGICVCVIGAALFLIYKEPDLGATVILAGIAMLILLCAGMNWTYAGLAAVAGGAAIAYKITKNVYQMRRIQGFWNPWGDSGDTGYQLINSLYALGSGGFWGVGIGNSRQKLGFLPEQYMDFIYAIIGEELGLIGAGLILLLFLLLAWRGYLVALRAADLFGCLLAVGITTSLVLQAAINIAVVTGTLPVTGITLPFLSYGGSSLLMSMGAVGVLINISRHRKT